VKDINFFKPYLGKNKEKINSKMYIYGSATIVGILIIGSFIFNTTKIFLVDRSINSYKEKLAVTEIQEKLKEADSINKQTELLKQYDSVLSDVAVSVKKRDNVSEVLLKDISSTVPSQVSFKEFEMVDNTIIIKGISTDRAAMAELKHNLSNLLVMQDVYVNSIDTQSAVEGEYSFEIKCVLKDVG
jgi:type IV pilus assembly protein PilN